MKDLTHFLFNLPITLSDSVTVDLINQIKIDAPKILGTFLDNLRILKKKVSYIHDISLEDDTIEQQQAREIVEIFKKTVGKSLEELENYLNKHEQEKKEKILFETAFIDLLIKVLDNMCQFWKMIDNLYPNLSGKLINYISDLLVGLIATQTPVIGLLIKGSGILDLVKSFLKIENLTKWKNKLVELKDKLSEIEKQPNLGKKYQLAKLIAKIVEETELPALYIAELGLNNESLEKINNLIKKDPKEKDSFVKIVHLFQEMPRSKGMVTKGIDAIKRQLFEVIPGQLVELKDDVTRGLSSAKDNLFAALSLNTNILERFNYCFKAAKNLMAIEEKIRGASKSVIGGEKIITRCKKIIIDQTKNIIPEGLLRGASTLKSSLEILSDLIKIGSAMRVILTSDKSKTAVMVRER